jgi:hypothetical protein
MMNREINGKQQGVCGATQKFLAAGGKQFEISPKFVLKLIFMKKNEKRRAHRTHRIHRMLLCGVAPLRSTRDTVLFYHNLPLFFLCFSVCSVGFRN